MSVWLFLGVLSWLFVAATGMVLFFPGFWEEVRDEDTPGKIVGLGVFLLVSLLFGPLMVWAGSRR